MIFLSIQQVNGLGKVFFNYWSFNNLPIFRDKELFGGSVPWFSGWDEIENNLFVALVLLQLDIVRPNYNVGGIT